MGYFVSGFLNLAAVIFTALLFSENTLVMGMQFVCLIFNSGMAGSMLYLGLEQLIKESRK